MVSCRQCGQTECNGSSAMRKDTAPTPSDHDTSTQPEFPVLRWTNQANTMMALIIAVTTSALMVNWMTVKLSSHSRTNGCTIRPKRPLSWRSPCIATRQMQSCPGSTSGR